LSGSNAAKFVFTFAILSCAAAVDRAVPLLFGIWLVLTKAHVLLDLVDWLPSIGTGV
jgi:hypothetical protein